MLDIEKHRLSDLSDAALINHWIDRLCDQQGGGDIALGPRRYVIDSPIVLRSGIRLRGEGAAVTVLAASPELRGPVIISHEAQALAQADAWFASEGVPVRFRVSDLMIDGQDGPAAGGFGAGCGMHLYGKGFEIRDVQISHMKGVGLMSVGSARGGQETWQDEPEALFDIRISRCDSDGFVMRGPHDSIIRQAIIAICNGRGLAVEADGTFNGACDVEFCHAYGTDKVAIDLNAKVKAGFLQGDTGRGSGVRISGSNMTYVDRIEVFKTRGTREDFALDITAPYTQVGLARVRADWGASGVRIAAPHCQIGSLDIDGLRKTGGPFNGTENDTTALQITKGFARIGAVNARNFPQGTGIELAPALRGVALSGVTENCGRHLVANGLNGCDVALDMLLGKTGGYSAQPGPEDRFLLRRF
jgi:hypothetical protein